LSFPSKHRNDIDMNTGLEECFLGDARWTSTVTDSEAQERIDLGVSPSDEKWNDTYRMFEDLFADEDTSIGEILASKFTQHEILLFMLSASKILKVIQDDNTTRFHRLLQTKFQGVASEIITKLTMLYYGLPIEPIDFSLTDMTYKMEIREPESPQSVGDPPLHFLTAHKERNWGDESPKGELDNFFIWRSIDRLLTFGRKKKTNRILYPPSYRISCYVVTPRSFGTAYPFKKAALWKKTKIQCCALEVVS
jgi:hypothetical protein